MKTQIRFLLVILTVSNCLLAKLGLSQAPQTIPYQAVARNATGNLLSSQNVALRFSLHDGTAAGTIVYQETQNVTTNNLGLFTVNLGQGTPVIGTLAVVNWANGAKFLQVELDPTGGTNYTDMGTTPFNSVPYALNSATSNDNKWVSNGNNISNTNTGKVGIGINTPGALFHVNDMNGLQNTPSADLVLSRVWNNPSDTRASAVFHYYSTATGIDNLAFGVSGDGGSHLAPNALNQIKMMIQGNGNVGIGTTTPLGKLHVKTGSLILDDAGQRFFVGGYPTWDVGGDNNNYAISRSGIDYPFVINRSTGNVGIGETTPAAKLDINGSIKIVDGTQEAYKVLTSDANGLARWRNPFDLDSFQFTNNIPVSTPDNSCTGANSTISVSGLPTKLNTLKIKVTLTITHAVSADLRIFLIAPNGDILNLAYGLGGSGVNFTNTVFSDEGTAITGGSAPFTGNFKPHGTMTPACSLTPTINTFAGLGTNINPNGNWILSIIDSGSIAVGTLQNWKIDFIPTTPINNSIPCWLNGSITSYNNLFSVGLNMGVGTSTPKNLVSLGSMLGTNPSDSNGKKLAVYNNSTGNDFYGLGASNGVLQFHAGSIPSENPQMVMNAAGMVRIGAGSTSSYVEPTAPLQVNGIYTGPSLPGSTSAAIVKIYAGSEDGINIGKSNASPFPGWIQSGYSGTNPDPLSLNALGGYVGIGTSNPQAPLHVAGAGITTPSFVRGYFSAGTGTSIVNNTSSSGNVQVRADGWYWANNGGFVATSDKRIKNKLGLTNTQKDLDDLNKIEITDYKYIDEIANGSKVHKKVIAQQLNSVYPLAVDTNQGTIPNVFETAKSSSIKNNMTIVETSKAHDFKTGDEVKLILESNGEKIVSVDVIDEHTFSFNEKIEDNIFVYGKKVNDLLIVDYDALTTLNISATQALLKRIELLEKENNQLKTLNTANADKLATLEVKLNSIIQLSTTAQK